MGGKQEEATWTYNAILNSIVVGHGYTLFSRQVHAALVYYFNSHVLNIRHVFHLYSDIFPLRV